MLSIDFLIKEIIEKTDLMIQALRVDDADIFEEALGLREGLIQQLQGNFTDDIQFQNYRDVYGLKIVEMEKQLNFEFQASQSRLVKGIKEVQLERSSLKDKSIKTGKYFTPPTDAGSYFDKKK